jgi:hypothetical protein
MSNADDANTARHAAGIACGFLLVCVTLLCWVAAFQASAALGCHVAGFACWGLFGGVYMVRSCGVKLRNVFRGLP